MERTTTGGFGSPPSRLGPMDIQQKEFRVSRLGGYKMRDVDEFLDELTTSMTALVAENDRLRDQAGAAPVLGSPDLDDVGRQADEIIQRARDEAAQILSDARAGASASRAIGTASPDDRRAVDAFLLQEREFLQGLAALVQGHAESVKSMARASRAQAPTTGAEAPPVDASTVEAPRPVEGAEPPPPSDTVRAETEPVASDMPEPEAPEVVAAEGAEGSAPEATIRLDEPQPARKSGGDADADGSLRDLFWGEED
jgi:DivIVA domain-containing protein